MNAKFYFGVIALCLFPTLVSGQHDSKIIPVDADNLVLLPGQNLPPTSLSPLDGTEFGVVPILSGFTIDPLTGQEVIVTSAAVLNDPVTGAINNAVLNCDEDLVGLNVDGLSNPNAGSVFAGETFVDNGDGTVTMLICLRTEGDFPLDPVDFEFESIVMEFSGMAVGLFGPALQFDTPVVVQAAELRAFDTGGAIVGQAEVLEQAELELVFGVPGAWDGTFGFIFGLNTGTRFSYELSVTYAGNLPDCASDDCPNSPGDLNGDGITDLLDVQPFVAAIVGSTLSPCEADVNGDGSIDLLDVDPFVQLILGG